MDEIAIEQARWQRDDHAAPRLLARSPGFADDWLAGVERLVIGFGMGTGGLAWPPAVFAQPLGVLQVAVVQVLGRSAPPALVFHVLVVQRPDYEQLLGEPFALARKFPAAWEQAGPLPTLTVPRQSLSLPTVTQVQGILQRVKAGALREDEDPEHPDFQRTVDNSESPALLGGVQVLVEGGKLVFERAQPDPDLVESLWTLLPQSTRARLWPASFAFSNALGFDAVVVPRIHAADFEGYTSEEQAAEYPAGHYELALQIAAESGNQRDLDALLRRRSSGETYKLAWTLLAAVIFLVMAPRLIEFLLPPSPPDIGRKAAAAAGIVASGNPWTALGLKLHGDSIWMPRKGDAHE